MPDLVNDLAEVGIIVSTVLRTASNLLYKEELRGLLDGAGLTDNITEEEEGIAVVDVLIGT